MLDLELPTRYLLEGIRYYEFFRKFHALVKPASYFEIGVNKGKSLSRVECSSVGVDPKFIVSDVNVIGEKPFLFLAQVPSDVFFEKYNLSDFFPKGVDVAFLDGMHNFEFLLRDFMNAEKFSHSKSIYFLHDCLPINYEMAVRTQGGERIDKEYQSHWTGDVWKLYPILKKYRPDLKITILDCPPTGLVAIENMDPDNSILRENYDEIVAKYFDVPFGEEDLLSLRESMEITSSIEYLETISDHQF